jgi:hypothetical protein
LPNRAENPVYEPTFSRRNWLRNQGRITSRPESAGRRRDMPMQRWLIEVVIVINEAQSRYDPRDSERIDIVDADEISVTAAVIGEAGAVMLGSPSSPRCGRSVRRREWCRCDPSWSRYPLSQIRVHTSPDVASTCIAIPAFQWVLAGSLGCPAHAPHKRLHPVARRTEPSRIRFSRMGGGIARSGGRSDSKASHWHCQDLLGKVVPRPTGLRPLAGTVHPRPH